MTNRSYYQSTIESFLQATGEHVLGVIASNAQHEINDAQKASWQSQVKTLKDSLAEVEGHIAFEYVIPRIGKRVDVVLLHKGVVFVLEYKVGSSTFDKHAIDQAVDYALDLKNFHAGSHHLPIVPILVATRGADVENIPLWAQDSVAEVALANDSNLYAVISLYTSKGSVELDGDSWLKSGYRPTPTIVEAACALYDGHEVEDISHSEGGGENLSVTAAIVDQIIETSKNNSAKSICFITGVPGSGKTLAGLNIATKRKRGNEDEHAVFLSGNGPLVSVLREALTCDAVAQAKLMGINKTKKDEERKTHSFIQNIHHFRDDCLANEEEAPVEHVVIFDEAQRAWNLEKTAKFMQNNKGKSDFYMSEPQFLLDAMNRHEDWCVVICLVGGGQEIHEGEAGIGEWLRAVHSYFKDWNVYISNRLGDKVYQWHEEDDPLLLDDANTQIESGLHLSVDMRSFRAEKLADFVEQLILCNQVKAKEEFQHLANYPIYLTRDLEKTRHWLNGMARGSERIGLVASSSAIRLKPHGVFVKSKIDPKHWFLKGKEDVRSSYALEDIVSEFDIQGLELDWAGVCWDANLRMSNGAWIYKNFRGSKWINVNKEENRRFLRNAYRVLLTRARQGMIIFVPEGDESDITRLPEFYDPIFEFLIECGIEEI